jgi:hypothetical protein
MSANPIELFTAYTGLNKLSEVERTGRPERRNRARIQVHWPVLFFRTDPPEAVESVTQNLSSRGFYCFSKVPLTVGEILACTIRVPAHDPAGKELDRQLDCKVRVTRVEADAAEGLFGIACRLEDYHVARTADSNATQ